MATLGKWSKVHMPGSAWTDGAHRTPKRRANGRANGRVNGRTKAIAPLFFIDLKNDITDPE
jgi:hypothetical protein